MSTPTWENQMRLEVNRDAEPPDRDRDCGGGSGEAGGSHRGLEDRHDMRKPEHDARQSTG